MVSFGRVRTPHRHRTSPYGRDDHRCWRCSWPRRNALQLPSMWIPHCRCWRCYTVELVRFWIQRPSVGCRNSPCNTAASLIRVQHFLNVINSPNATTFLLQKIRKRFEFELSAASESEDVFFRLLSSEFFLLSSLLIFPILSFKVFRAHTVQVPTGRIAPSCSLLLFEIQNSNIRSSEYVKFTRIAILRARIS